MGNEIKKPLCLRSSVVNSKPSAHHRDAETQRKRELTIQIISHMPPFTKFSEEPARLLEFKQD
jgi:hypothetical protein